MFIFSGAKAVVLFGIIGILFSLQINDSNKYLTLSDKNRFLADPNLVSIKEENYIYVEDCGDDSEIEIIDNKKVIDFLNTFKTILDNPNIKGEFRTNLTDALINQDYGMLDAEDMDYILQTCIFGSCVYG